MTQPAEDLTIEEMLDECIRVRPESRDQVVCQLDNVLTALNRGENAPSNDERERDLWVLHRNGTMQKYKSA